MKEQTALRPKPMPGREPGTCASTCASTSASASDPDPARWRRSPRRRRLTTVLLGVLAAALLLLAGVGLATVGATVTGMSGPAELRRQAATVPPPAPRAAPAPSPTRSSTLGVEAVDDEGPGALVVAVHVPGPGYTAGLVRGDVLLAVGTTRVDTATDLAHAVSRTHPGREIKLTIRHESGAYQQLTAVPGVVT